MAENLKDIFASFFKRGWNKTQLPTEAEQPPEQKKLPQWAINEIKKNSGRGISQHTDARGNALQIINGIVRYNGVLYVKNGDNYEQIGAVETQSFSSLPEQLQIFIRKNLKIGNSLQHVHNQLSIQITPEGKVFVNDKLITDLPKTT
ncbi:hypothetical protein KBB12_04610 [Candidatus Woesebacteria bacterium]|nr:hypothetical protein [Candidatus Woesebacteria bacterium]